jgi:N-dimethylarginine dimethylaminohydrolase
MCPPDHFTVEYAINPWMTTEVPVDSAAAREQCLGIVAAIEAAGGRVSTIAPDPALPDMVFTANAGLVSDGVFAPARMRFPERGREPELAAAWAAAAGLDVRSIDVGTFEGMGDALPFGDVFVAGHGQRSDMVAWRALSRRLGIDFAAVELPDPRFYHIDLVFSPLSNRSALVAPTGLTKRGLQTIRRLVPDPILLTDDEATSFTANSIVVGDTVISPAASPRIQTELGKRGFRSVITPVPEFLKAGGAVRCLTLPLDVLPAADLAQTA